MEGYLSILATISSSLGSWRAGTVSVSLPAPPPEFTRLSSTERQDSSVLPDTWKVVDSFYQEVLGLTDYEGFHQKKQGNIFLLNAFFKDSGFSYPMKAGLSVTATFIFGKEL